MSENTITNTLTPNQLIALEAYARYGDGSPVQGAAEVLRHLKSSVSLDGASVAEVDIWRRVHASNARDLYTWAGNSGIISLALWLLPIHKDHTPGELAARTGLSKEEAERIIAALPKPSKAYETHISNWSPTAARKWLMSYARHLSSDARYIRKNADGFAENEEEFRCGLANGLGIDSEEEQTEIIRKFMEKDRGKEKEEKKS